MSRVDRKAAKSQYRIRGLYAWGISDNGQLGLGPEVKEKATPTLVPGFEHVLQFAASGSYSLVLKAQTDNTQVFEFGKNEKSSIVQNNSQESLSIAPTGSPIPDKYDSEAGASDASPSHASTGALSSGYSEGTIISPRNPHTLSPASSKVSLGLNPQLISSLSHHKVIQVACGETHSLVLTSQGKLFSWGYGKHGQLGLGSDVEEEATPREVRMDGVYIASIAAGGYHSAIITKSNALYTFGLGTFGQLGHQDFENNAIPTRVEFFEDKDVSSVACGLKHTAVLTNDGIMYTWGSNEDRQLGHSDHILEDLSSSSSSSTLPTTSSSENQSTTSTTVPQNNSSPPAFNYKRSSIPIKIQWFESKSIGIKQICCGANHTAVVSTDGSVYVFGSGDTGELGLGSMYTLAVAPALVPCAQTITRIYCGVTFTAFISDVGDIWYTGKFPGAFERCWTPRKYPGPFLETFFHSLAYGSSHVLALIDTGDQWRNKCIGRIISTERIYLRTLSLTVHEISPIAEMLVGPEVWNSIIGQMNQILTAQTSLIKRLDSILDTPTLTQYCVSQAFIEQLSKPEHLMLYSGFASNFGSAWEKFLGCLKSVPSLSSYLEALFLKEQLLHMPLSKSRSPEQFIHFLQAPTLHYAEVQLLLEDLLSLTPQGAIDRKELESAHKLCSEAAELIKGATSGNREFSGLLQFVSSFPTYQSLLQPHRRYIMSASFNYTEKKAETASNLLYLLNDMLILVSPSSIVEQVLPLQSIFIQEVSMNDSSSFVLVTTTLQTFRIFFEKKWKSNKFLERSIAAINELISSSIEHKEARMLAGMQLLTQNLDLVMPVFTKSWKTKEVSSPREAATGVIRGMPIGGSDLTSMSDMISRTCLSLENDKTRKERNPVWGSASVGLFSNLSLYSPSTITEPFILFIEAPGTLKERKYSTLTKTFGRKKRKNGFELFQTNLGPAHSGSISGTYMDSFALSPYNTVKKQRVALRARPDMQIRDAKIMLHRAAEESPWSESLELKPVSEYVFKMSGLDFYLTNENMPFNAVPLLQTISCTTQVTPFLELIHLSKGPPQGNSRAPCFPNIKYKGDMIQSLYVPNQPRPNIDAEMEVFDEVSTLMGGGRSKTIPNEDMNSFRHFAAGLRIQMLKARKQRESFMWPEYKGLETMPSKLPAKLTLLVYLPLINNEEKHTLQVSPDASIAFIYANIFRHLYKHEKHKTREKFTKFVKRIIDTEPSDSSSSEVVDEEVEYIDPKELLISPLPTVPPGSKSDVTPSGSKTELPIDDSLFPSPNQAIVELPDKSSRGKQRKALRASWKKDEEEDNFVPPTTPSPKVESILSTMLTTDEISKLAKRPTSPRSSKEVPYPLERTVSTPTTPGRVDIGKPSSVPPSTDHTLAKSMKFSTKDKAKEKELAKSKDKKRPELASSVGTIPETGEDSPSTPQQQQQQQQQGGPTSSNNVDKESPKRMNSKKFAASHDDVPMVLISSITPQTVVPTIIEEEESPRSTRKRGKSFSNETKEKASTSVVNNASSVVSTTSSFQNTGEEFSTPPNTAATNASSARDKTSNLDEKSLSTAGTASANVISSAHIADAGGLTDNESDEDGGAKKSKKEEERLRKMIKEEKRLQKKVEEKQKKEAKKLNKDLMKKAKKDETRAKKEEKKEKKKQKKLHGGKGLEDFILKINGSKEFLLPGITDDRPSILLDYDYIRRAISNQTPIELRFVEKALVPSAARVGSSIADYEDQLIDRCIARFPLGQSRFETLESDSIHNITIQPKLPILLPSDTDTVEIYLDENDKLKGNKPYWALKDEHAPFRIRIMDLDHVGFDQQLQRSNLYVSAVLHYPMRHFKLKAFTSIVPFSSDAAFNEELVMPIKICHLPREAKLTIIVYARVETSNTKPKRLSSDIPLGWVNIRIFDHKGILKQGVHGLRLWSGAPEHQSICCENTIDEMAGMISICILSPNQNHSMTPDSQPGSLAPKQRRRFLPANSAFSSSISSGTRDSTSAITATTSSISSGKDGGKFSTVNSNEDNSGHQIIKSTGELTDQDKRTILEICNRDVLAYISDDNGLLLVRHALWIRSNIPDALPKLLKFIDWKDQDCVREVHQLLNTWPNVSPMVALQLIDSKFADQTVRTFAVNKCLDQMSDNDFYRILLQLIQAIKYEPYHNSALAQLLLRRSFVDSSRRIAHFFFWQLKSEMRNPVNSERFGLLFEAFSKGCGHVQRLEFISHSKVLTWLHEIAEEIKNRRGSVASKTAKLQERLSKAHWPEKFNYPLDPRVECVGFEIDQCRVLGSKTVPLLLTMKTAETLAEPLQMIYKIGDDLRQDALTLQIIVMIDDIWKREGLDMRLKPYSCMALGPNYGIIEVVRNASTTSNINIELGGVFAVIADSTLLKWLKKHNPTEKLMSKAIENFIYSCAGYTVITFILGFADRHNDNIMLSKQGHLFHIDFGHFLGHYRKVLGKYVDKAETVFIDQYVGVMGKENYITFESICCQAYNIVRKHADLLFTLFSLMLASGLPELQSNADIEFMKDRLQVYLTPEEAADYFKRKLRESHDNSTLQWNHAFHVFYQGMKS